MSLEPEKKETEKTASPNPADRFNKVNRKTTIIWTEDGPVLCWTAPKGKGEMDRARQYVVYRFGPREKVNLNDASHIFCITEATMLPLSYQGGKTKYTYVVTALDRLQNESKAVRKKIKL